MYRQFFTCVFASGSVMVFAGCGEANPDAKHDVVGAHEAHAHAHGHGHGLKAHADPHDVPLTPQEIQQLRKEVASYANAISRIEQYRETVRQETKDGLPANPFKVHRALDELDHVLGWLPEIARDSGIPKSQWETVTTSSQKLQELFDAVHRNIDDGKAPDFEAVAAAVSVKINKLQEVASAAKPSG